MVDAPHITQNFGRPSYRPEAAAGMDPDMRRMAIIAAGLGGLVVVAFAAVSLSHRVHHAIPIIQAAAGPVRIKPIDPGGMKVVGAEEAASGVESLAPQPEKPAIRALRARTRPHASETSVARAALPAPVAAATTPQILLPQKPVAAPASVAPSIAARTAPVAASVAALGGTAVQLAAFETPQAAQQDWDRLSAKTPGLLNGHQPVVERAEVAGRTVFRLRTGGFADIASATIFCGRVRSHGSDCSIAAF